MPLSSSKWLLLSGSLACWLSCSTPDPIEKNPPQQPVQETISSLPCRFVEVREPNARLRTTPDLQGAVVEMLSVGAILRYLDDSTRFTTAVEMRGKKVEHHWYKCQSSTGTEGWMYGGIFRFLSEDENRKFSAACLPQLTTSDSTQKTPTQVQPNKRPVKIEVADQAAVDAYQNYLQRLSKRSFESVRQAVSHYETALQNANEATCDAAFFAFWQYYQSVKEETLRQYNVAKYDRLAAEIQRYGRVLPTQDSFLYRLSLNGFDLGASGNKVYLREDMDFMMRHFYRFVSPALQIYLEQSKKEMYTPLLLAEKLAVSLTEVADRAVYWDKLLIQYPNFAFRSPAQQAYKNTLTILLRGTKGTPAFANGALQPDFKKAYFYLQEKHAGSTTQRIVQDYLKLIEEQEGKDTDVVRRYQTEVLGRY